jgi:hypothetical protein
MTHNNITKLKIVYTIIFLTIVSEIFSQQSQNVILEKFESGKYTVYKINDKSKLEKVEKSWPIEFTKSGNRTTKILIKRSGILDELFEPDIPGYPAYFLFKGFRLSFINDYGVYYEWNGKQQAKTKYVFVKEGNGYSLDFASTNKNIEEYIAATFKNQTDARANVKEERIAQLEIDRKNNSLQGKDVSKIEIQFVSPPSQVAHFSSVIFYGILATLKDGSVLKSPNLGGKLPWSDFKISHEGCSNTIDEIRVDNDAINIPNDQIVLNVASIYHPTLKVTKTINTTNDVSVQINKGGFRGLDRHQYVTVFQGVDGQNAGDGENLIIKVLGTKHKQTGEPINKIEIFSATKNMVVARLKLTPSTELIVNTKGGRGMDGSKGYSSKNVGGNGGNGGNGGSVTIIKDPSVGNYQITVNNEGGKGGNGGPPYSSTGLKGNSGNNGLDGNTTSQSKSITLNF